MDKLTLLAVQIITPFFVIKASLFAAPQNGAFVLPTKVQADVVRSIIIRVRIE